MIILGSVKELMVSAGINMEYWLVSRHFHNFFTEQKLSFAQIVPFVKGWNTLLRAWLEVPNNTVGLHAMTKKNDDIAWIMLINFLTLKDCNRNFHWDGNDFWLFDGMDEGSYHLKAAVLFEFLLAEFKRHGFTLEYFLYSEQKLRGAMNWIALAKHNIYQNLGKIFVQKRAELKEAISAKAAQCKAEKIRAAEVFEGNILQRVYINNVQSLPTFDDEKQHLVSLHQAIGLKKMETAQYISLCADFQDPESNDAELIRTNALDAVTSACILCEQARKIFEIELIKQHTDLF